MTDLPQPPTPALPPNVSPTDEIAVTWERDEENTRVVASLAEASVTIDCSPESAHVVPWLIAAMPSVLEAAWEGIERQEAQQ